MSTTSREVIGRLRAGKAALRYERRNASLHDKLLALVRAQRMYLEVVRTRRPLKSWERPWDVMSDVQAAVIIKDGIVERRNLKPKLSGGSSSQWVRPLQRLLLPL